jgi:LysM repeat protein
VDRSRYTRWAAPIAFLAAVTILALLIRSGLEGGKRHHAKGPSTTVTSKRKKTRGHGNKPPHKQTYTVVSGDTLAGIAAKKGTTVARLEQLNPGIDPTALHVGQSIRVK